MKPFISYAQNFEDVILFRVFKNIKKGVYIDVGACDPVTHSVTKAFYLRGWRGINIEPVDFWFNKLLADRPEDTNLKIAAAAKRGSQKFYEVVDTGLSTSIASIAETHAAEGMKILEREVLTDSLDNICGEHNISEVHFLKIDVEGSEKEVLRGIDLMRIRPWVVVVEATFPNSSILTYKKWEEILFKQNYEFVYFDGLSCFYIPKEREKDLTSFLSNPPNFFDQFICYTEVQKSQQIEELSSRLLEENAALSRAHQELAQSHSELSKTQEELAQSHSELSKTQEEFADTHTELSSTQKELGDTRSVLSAIINSRSWRMTSFLRKLRLYVDKIIHKMRKVFSKYIIQGAKQNSNKDIQNNNGLKLVELVHEHERLRAHLTIKCRDADSIPKVKDAGFVQQIDGKIVQIMHNGLKVIYGGYHGDWMGNIIKGLRGHHEPQEEKAFDELLRYCNPNTCILELGSFWAYYSMWFLKRIPKGRAYCLEPDVNYLSIGQKNMQINGLKADFINASIGNQYIAENEFKTEAGQILRIPQHTVSSVMNHFGIDEIEILHADAQGAELDLLLSSEELFSLGKIRFLVISTHHASFTNSEMTHENCLSFLLTHGAWILCEHNMKKSFSGDGLIVAAMRPEDKVIPSFQVSLCTESDDIEKFKIGQKIENQFT